MKTALVIGSTGLIGKELLSILLANPTYNKVVTFVKRDTGIEHTKLTQHITDFSNLESYQNLVIGDDFFCAIGTTIKKAGSPNAFRQVDFEYPRQFANFALQNKVKQFLLISSLNADVKSNNFYLKTKGAIQDYLKNCEFENVAILQPSILLGDRSEFRLGEKVGSLIMQIFSFVFQGNLKKYRAIESKIVAKAMFKIAQKNDIGFNIYQSDAIQEIGN